jgi:hypothetical protein
MLRRYRRSDSRSSDQNGHSLIEPLYHWAGFVLHGHWMFPLPSADARQLGRANPMAWPENEGVNTLWTVEPLSLQ